jgi:bacterioferritin
MPKTRGTKLTANTQSKSSNDKLTRIVAELKHAYAMELETVQNYLANSIDLDGVRAEEIKKSLGADIAEELRHAMILAKRIKVLGGRVPGSLELERDQKYLQPPADSTDLITIIKGVIQAEEGAIAQYEKIIGLCEQVDFVTQDLVIGILGDEQEHRRTFVGFLTEFEKRK